jgi:hypothetical protein
MDMLIRIAVRTTGVGAMLAAVALTAQAQGPAQFASFSQASTSNRPFRYIYDATTPTNSRFGLYDAGGNPLTGANALEVNFQYQVTNGYNGNNFTNNIPALMEMTTLVDGLVTGGTLPGQTIEQNFRAVRITFTAINPGLTPGTNLLTVTAVLSSSAIDPDIPRDNGSLGTTASLQGRIGTSTGSFDATEAQGLDLNYIGYTSDFLDFTNPTFVNRNFSIALANITPSVARGTGAAPASDYFRAFEASAAGTFGSDPVPAIPEPASLSLLAIGMVGAPLMRRRRMMRK